MKVTARISHGRARPSGEDVGDAGGQHARLAGAGAGQHQHRAVERLDRLALLGVEAGEIGRGRARAHGARGNAARRRLRVALDRDVSLGFGHV